MLARHHQLLIVSLRAFVMIQHHRAVSLILVKIALYLTVPQRANALSPSTFAERGIKGQLPGQPTDVDIISVFTSPLTPSYAIYRSLIDAHVNATLASKALNSSTKGLSISRRIQVTNRKQRNERSESIRSWRPSSRKLRSKVTRRTTCLWMVKPLTPR